MRILEGISVIEKLLNWLNIGNGNPQDSSYVVAETIIAIAVILFMGFLATRITKKLKLPNVTAYIVTGILIGPFLGLVTNHQIESVIPQRTINGMGFLTDIALAFIAFGAGEFFKLKELKEAGFKVVIITIFEALGAFILVFIVALLLQIPIHFAIILAALSSATAPASTIMTIRQTKAKGPYVNTLLEVVALDDVVSLLLYSVSISVCIALSGASGSFDFKAVIVPILYTILCVGIGVLFGFLLKLLLPKTRTTDNRLIIVIATIFLFCGICALFGQSPLLGCMAMGMVYTNICKPEDTLFKQLAYFQPPIMLCFFVLSGMKFNFGAFTSNENSVFVVPLVVIALVYFVVRVVGKYGGAFIGSLITKQPKPIRNYLGLGLVPQAGVAIGLSAMGARILETNGFPELGLALSTIILASSVLYELVGPATSKLGLYLSHSYGNIDEDAEVEKEELEQKGLSEVEILIAQIKDIESKKDYSYLEEQEKAFVEAASELDEDYYVPFGKNRFINRK